MRNDVEGPVLGTYTGFMKLDQKIEITNTNTFLRGRWIHIIDEAPTSSGSERMKVADVRVYGSE